MPMRKWLGLVVLTALLPIAAAGGEDDSKADGIRVPYQLTETKHILVRARINGKGPFHFILDTGAPALYLGTAAAKRAGVKADANGWGVLERLEVEGGVKMKDVRARIEDPFQLTGMNKMNLPGIRYDGMMGYTVMAKYRIEIDFTDPHMVWKDLRWEPPVPLGFYQMGGKAPVELSAMGALVNFATAFLGRRPDPEIIYRGFLGVELTETGGKVRIARVLAQSPADQAGLRKGDVIKSLQNREVSGLKQALDQAAGLAEGQEVQIVVERSGESVPITVKPSKGL